MVYCETVAAYLRTIIDESDATFISDADISTFLSIAYEEFRQLVSDVDPNQFIVSQNYTLASADTLDLSAVANIIMGASVVAPQQRLMQIVRIVSLDGSGNVTNIMNPVYSYESLITQDGAWNSRYMLQGTTIKFSALQTGVIRIEYVPLSDVDWTQITTGDNEFIDDMVAMHDLIGLLAAKSYFMIDGADNKSILTQIQTRLGHLNDFTERGRIRNANRYVGTESYGFNQ